MCITLDRFFKIRDIINVSDNPLTIKEISNLSGLEIRTCQRYAIRLAQERLVDFKVNSENKMGLGYIYAYNRYWDNKGELNDSK